jgi:hypothetical protein
LLGLNRVSSINAIRPAIAIAVTVEVEGKVAVTVAFIRYDAAQK